ncbi:POFUT2 family protein [Megaselia abdita]
MNFCVFLSIFLLLFSLSNSSKTCKKLDTILQWDPKKCSTLENFLGTKRPIYIIYDVNPFEGFNLRRDVYIRWAVLTKHLQRIPLFRDVRLVLPPYPRLYHWKSSAFNQENLSWDMFFDLHSMKKFAPVFDFTEFLEEVDVFSPSKRLTVPIDKIFQLQHFEEMFENGVFIDKFEYHNCSRAEVSPGDFLQQTNIHGKDFVCLKFQGSASLLTNVLKKEIRSYNDPWPKVFFFLSGEIVLHDNWGNQEFWRARRSMRFSNDLMAIAKDFRLSRLNSTDETEKVNRPVDWRLEKETREAIGGDYVCAHLRRGDFVFGREKTIPSMKSAANQIKQVLKELGLKKVFIASDCSPFGMFF